MIVLAFLAVVASAQVFDAATFVKTDRSVHARCAMGPGVLEMRCLDTAERILAYGLELLPYEFNSDPTDTKRPFYKVYAKLPKPLSVAGSETALLAFLKDSGKVKYHFKEKVQDVYVLTRDDLHGLHEVSAEASAEANGQVGPMIKPPVYGGMVKSVNERPPMAPGSLELSIVSNKQNIRISKMAGKAYQIKNGFAHFAGLRSHFAGRYGIDGKL